MDSLRKEPQLGCQKIDRCQIFFGVSSPAGAGAPVGFLSSKVVNMNQTRLFVGNLSFKTGEQELKDYFSQAGVVTSVNLMVDKFTGKSRGFAFIEYATPEEAQRAVDQFNSKEFQGRTLTVNIARPREERPPREGGFRRDNRRRRE
ncbi:MAG: RNA recognition motif domain-containing protein [Verrucomicrobiia bacterium]